MLHKLTTKKAILIIVIAVLAIEGGYLLFQKTTSEAGATAVMEGVMEGEGNRQKMDAQILRTNLEKQIENSGAAQTYEDFKEAFRSYGFGINHAAAHVMGDLLFMSKGLDGLTICDSTFAFGCYHAFFGRALSELGLGAIEKLDEVCIKQYGPLGTGCQHGIGHGILEYFGNNKLADALQACSRTTQIKEQFGCTSGIFMEYNFPTDIQPDKTTSNVRELKENPYAPCNTIVPEEYKKSCYFEQNQWWSQIYGDDLKKNIELCTNIPEKDYQKSCFLGLGEISAPATKYNPSTAIEICENIPNKDHEVLCKAGSSWGFFADPAEREHATKICETLPQERRKLCINESDLIGNEEIKSVYEQDQNNSQ